MLRTIQILTFLICLTAFGPVTAQTIQATDSTAASAQDAWQISLLTVGPGPVIYELEGHSGLRMKRGDVDEVANWGVFDFESPGFIYRFVKGETDYMLGMSSFDHFVAPYAYQGRAMTEQVLNLTPKQAEHVVALVRENLKPENKVYRYNYIRDNCSTRPLAVIEKAIGDTIILGAPDAKLARKATFRKNMRMYHRNYPWYQFGIDLALGSDLDQPIGRREIAFAPVALEEMMAEAKFADGKPLVKETVEILAPARAEITEGPTPWYLTPGFWCWTLFVITLALSWFDIYRHRMSRIFDCLLYLLLGLAGCVITFLVFFSVHEPASPNWLLLWINPLCLLVPILIWTKQPNGLLYCYQIANFAALLAMTCIWVAGIQQPNPAFIPLLAADALRSATYLILSRCNPSYRKRSTYRVNYYAR